MTRKIVRLFKPLIRRAIALGTLLLRPMTVGVRGAVLDGEGRVFLVRHTYLPGWYLPGGGVDPGETSQAAVIRELREEGNIEVEGRPELFGLYLNARLSRRNHVALYVIRAWRQPEPPRLPNREIAEAGFFRLDDLPAETTPATLRRLDEIGAERQRDEIW
ncbi:ADP-ribose pyrophosphatase YjhB (NUDIX family) [Breoghania corrubedonensis]|uniref:ADP-ribose pyrophosphatase YjhB (NUDIX family) n=1 Tax=Breoghania corrubedonensis TaxID=665038 RepID=A0A2T5UU13_9HYPH|nr:NUDIX domain-containing protein [Breoghania corrubedonensis]PTW54984.1 ADP-ribose pyrophosphatase YjhB (NUDIX family) [Breoghania corrubedonensis]